MPDESANLDEATRIQLIPSSDPQMKSPSLPVPQQQEWPVNLGDQYEILEAIGQGASGQVYKVWDRQLNALFAAKVLRHSLAADMQSVKRFSQEAAAAAGLAHSNVVTVYGCGEAKDGSPFLLMNFIEGESLASILKRSGALETKRAIALFSQVADGLQYAHSCGLVHRDLKPSNIIISKNPDGQELAHIVDFGIAKVVAAHSDTVSTLTASGDFIGTPAYMSPEQCLGQKVDHRTDIYAFGCMFYEALTGQAPYAGSHSVEIIARKISEEAPPLTSSLIRSDLSMIVACCTGRNPENRYDAARDLNGDFQLVSRNLPPRFASRKLRPDAMVFLKRLGAFVLDNAIVSTVGTIFMFVCFAFVGILAALIPVSSRGASDASSIMLGIFFIAAYFSPAVMAFVYFVWCEAKRGATLGKQLLGLRVCDSRGANPSLLRACGRNAAKALFTCVIPFSILMIFAIPNLPVALLIAFVATIACLAVYTRIIVVRRQFPWDVLAGCQVIRR